MRCLRLNINELTPRDRDAIRSAMTELMIEQCKTCKADILWLKHKSTRKAAPIDAEPDAKGNIFVRLETGEYRIATPAEIARAKEIAKPLYTNHFVTCPTADRHKRDKAHNALFAPPRKENK
jgi:hypothetical protein